MSTPDRVKLGARLRAQREARALSVADVVRLTKIPEKTLRHLEDGSFEQLPAAVFVRGFVKSYCRAVGLDAEQAVRDYEEVTRERRPRVASLARLGATRSETVPTAASVHAPASGSPGARPVEAQADDRDEADLSVYAALADAGRSTGRIGLTVAVIILVVVATLTMSLLLRKPGRTGNGVSYTVTQSAETVA
jgi:hypothetical protein